MWGRDWVQKNILLTSTSDTYFAMLTFSGMESNIVLVRKTHIPHHVVQFFRHSWTSPMKMKSGTDEDVTFYMVVKTNAEVTDNKNSNVTVGTGWTTGFRYLTPDMRQQCTILGTRLQCTIDHTFVESKSLTNLQCSCNSWYWVDTTYY